MNKELLEFLTELEKSANINDLHFCQVLLYNLKLNYELLENKDEEINQKLFDILNALFDNNEILLQNDNKEKISDKKTSEIASDKETLKKQQEHFNEEKEKNRSEAIDRCSNTRKDMPPQHQEKNQEIKKDSRPRPNCDEKRECPMPGDPPDPRSRRVSQREQDQKHSDHRQNCEKSNLNSVFWYPGGDDWWKFFIPRKIYIGYLDQSKDTERNMDPKRGRCD